MGVRSGQDDVAPVVRLWTMGLTPAPLTSGDVSTWAMNPMTGTCSLPGVARNRRHHVAVLIDGRIGDAHLLQLVDQPVSSTSCFAVLG